MWITKDEIQGLDAQFDRTPDGEFLLHHYTGDYYSAERRQAVLVRYIQISEV